MHIRDGGDLAIPGFAFAPVFSIWTTIEECLNPPIVWDEGEWRTTEPFSAAENFPFPEGVGPVECVNVEHEEVLLVPRWLKPRRVTFKYALGSDFIEKLRTIHALGMDRVDKVSVKGAQVAPRDVLAAITPDPAQLGDRMTGRAIVGTWVIGRAGNGSPREVFLYQTTDARGSVGPLRPGRGRMANWLQSGDRHGIARHRAPGAGRACSGQRHLTRILTLGCSTRTGSTTTWLRWNPGGTDRHDGTCFDNH